MLRDLMVPVIAALAVTSSAFAAREIHVAVDGDDSAPGTIAAPFATLARAVAAIDGDAPTTITLHAGTYRITETVTLAEEHSGTAGAPLVTRAAPGEAVRLTGGSRITGWQPVADATVVRRLPAEAREAVLQADLGALGIADLGGVNPGARRAELFLDQRYMTLARYPNRDFVRIADAPEEAKRARPAADPKRPDRDRHAGPFNHDGDRPERWAEVADVWVHGYWFHDWSDEYQRVERFDFAKNELWPEPPYHGYGYRKGQRYYYLNLLEELDEPGEWYLDRESGTLYFWPPSPVDAAEITFPELTEPMVSLANASHVSIRGITFECSRGSAIVVNEGSGCEIAGCTVRNVANVGIGVSDGLRHTVRSCDIYQVGQTGISVNAGDRATLSPAGHAVENCHIHHFAQVRRTYQHAISLHGVGNRISHCYIHDCPHAGIGYHGNDHTIEFCEFTRVARETGDVGCIYTAMDWTYTGHVFRHN